ncbi:MAG: DUF2917 domain-containing protein [Burkholderiaceae bacterium]
MQKIFVTRQYGIDAGRVLSVRDPAAVGLRVAAGRVWVTVAGSPDDHWLEPGDEFDLGTTRHVVVEAGGCAGIIDILYRAPCEAGRPAGLRERLVRALRRRPTAKPG